MFRVGLGLFRVGLWSVWLFMLGSKKNTYGWFLACLGFVEAWLWSFSGLLKVGLGLVEGWFSVCLRVK